MGSSSSKELLPPQISEELIAKAIPAAFRISYNKAFSLKTCCLLTKLNSDEPSYTVTLPNGWYGGMILHGGPTVDYLPLVTVTKEDGQEKDFVVNLPAIERAGLVARSEIVRHVLNMKNDIFWFEWRHSHGDEIKSLGQASTGWKLVRFGSGRAGEDIRPQPTTTQSNKFTKDGKEIIAVWAHGKTFGNIKNMGEFHFLGSGATDEFGIQWKLMAIMSLRTTQQSTTTPGV